MIHEIATTLSPARLLPLLSIIACVALFPRAASAQDSSPATNHSTQPTPRLFTELNGNTLPYLLLQPHNFDPTKHYPLILFFHGAGERGDDNRIQWKNGIQKIAEHVNQDKFPCFVIAPQCPKDKQWVNVPWGAESEVQPVEPSDELRMSLDILDNIEKEFPIDTSRLYVIGLSMGGYATWDATTRYPNRFAAAIPICGGGDETQAAKLKDLPVWAFHGANDQTVKTLRSRNMIAAIKVAGGHPKYTEYPGVGHDSWNNAFNEPDLFSWLFAQKRTN